MKNTTIRVRKSTALGLVKLKDDINESYDDVIVRLMTELVNLKVYIGNLENERRM